MGAASGREARGQGAQVRLFARGKERDLGHELRPERVTQRGEVPEIGENSLIDVHFATADARILPAEDAAL